MEKISSNLTLFGRRLREARFQTEIPHDKLGVMIGLDESCSIARMSRYENGVHEPPFKTIEKIAFALKLPVAYFFCDDDKLAKIIKCYESITEENRQSLNNFIDSIT